MSEARMVRLRDLGVWVGGNTPSKANAAYWTDGTVPWISPKDMKVDEITSSEDRITDTALTEGRVSLVPDGSVLFVTRSGILAHTFPVAVTKIPVTINQDLKALTPRAGVLPKYVAHAVRGASRRILKECSKHGTTVASIETNALLNFEIPLVDVDEQHRIVAEIEKQFSRLDEAVANLKRVKANLKRYKAAVLKAAVEGRLVPTDAELARQEGRDYETGAQLLQRVLAARRAEWRGSGKYREPVSPRGASQEGLPAGWALACVEQLNPAHRPCAYGVLQPGEDTDSGVPFVRVGDIENGKVAIASLKRINPSIAARYPRTRLEGGELLVTLVGAIGRTAVAPTLLRGANVARAVAVVPLTSEVDARWVEVWFRNPRKVALMNSLAHEVARKTLNLEDVRKSAVALPPFAEQVRIGFEAERLISIVEEVELETEKQMQRAQLFRGSVLASAFAKSSTIGSVKCA